MDMWFDQLAGLELIGVVTLGAATLMRFGLPRAGALGWAEQPAKLGGRQRQRAAGQRRLLTPGVELERAHGDRALAHAALLLCFAGRGAAQLMHGRSDNIEQRA